MLQQQYRLHQCQRQQDTLLLRPDPAAGPRSVPTAAVLPTPSAAAAAGSRGQLKRGAAQVTCSLIRRGDDVHTGADPAGAWQPRASARGQPTDTLVPACCCSHQAAQAHPQGLHQAGSAQQGTHGRGHNAAAEGNSPASSQPTAAVRSSGRLLLSRQAGRPACRTQRPPATA